MSHALTQLRGPIRALFSDLDGTITTSGQIEVATFAALRALCDAELPVVLVTGRPAGWGQALASLVPFTAVVTENGGVTFVREGRGFRKHYGVPEAELLGWREKMHAAVEDVAAVIEGARLSSDSAYREVDLAIDWNEECSLAVEDADRAAQMLRDRGFTATRSSVHVNFCPPLFNKFTACKVVVGEAIGGDPDDLGSYLYVGDALNDAPMFEGFPNSVGVANVRRWWDQLSHRPRFVTDSEEGAGFRELAAHISSLR